MGDSEYADRCELAAFNALPVMTTSDQWARQYIVLANQPFSYSLTGDLPFFNVGPDGIVYGTGKNPSTQLSEYGCQMTHDLVSLS